MAIEFIAEVKEPRSVHKLKGKVGWTDLKRWTDIKSG